MRLSDILTITGISLYGAVVLFIAGIGLLFAGGLALLLIFLGLSMLNYLNTGKIFSWVLIRLPKRGGRT